MLKLFDKTIAEVIPADNKSMNEILYVMCCPNFGHVIEMLKSFSFRVSYCYHMIVKTEMN